jgi:glycosyltransferase involved in cell wall biosynthesis
VSDRPGPPLRLAYLGDFDGAHTRRWLRVFVERGHDVHAISYYQPRAELPGMTLHVLRPASASSGGGARPASRSLGSRLPVGLQRLINGMRYSRAGLRRVVQNIAPDLLHAHYVVEHGYYGLFARYHPYVVSAWGSDLLVDAYGINGLYFAKRALRAADLVTANDPALAMRAISLGVPRENVAVVPLGIDRLFLEGPPSVNARADDATPPTVISDRALEPVYNVDVVLRAFARVLPRRPDARFVVAGDGSQRSRLEALARDLDLSVSVRFAGRLEPAALRDALAAAHVYVSVPRSDSLSLSTKEAMAAGAYPVVSDLPSLGDWLDTPATGQRVPPGNVQRLADALYEVLQNNERRRAAVAPNRARIEAEGLLEPNMLAMERHYYRLAGRPLPG